MFHDVVLRCSTPNCLCECFTPGKPLMRHCAHCNHGWIAHVDDHQTHILNEILSGKKTPYDVGRI
ncbi:tongue development [Dermatophagoides farinae]|uniref:Tongue development n=1 Tax=Dermatophagoides farinae TaxID=6954 RepID=A0A922HPF5_DERFA|nr:tongue development [Dermatophagoides farinae]